MTTLYAKNLSSSQIQFSETTGGANTLTFELAPVGKPGDRGYLPWEVVVLPGFQRLWGAGKVAVYTDSAYTHAITDLVGQSESGGGTVVSGGGAVTSVAGKTGNVTLTASDVNAVASVAGRSGTVVLTPADVGLANVNNTSDANKPVSTAQAAADAAVQAIANRMPLGAYMHPVASTERLPAPEACTQTWAASTGYTGEKTIAWNNAASLGLIDRGATLTASGAWGINTTQTTFVNPYVLEFWVWGTDVAINMALLASAPNGDYRIIVDGWDVSGWQTFSYPVSNTFLKLNWATGKTRLVRVEIAGAIIYAGLRLPSTGFAYANTNNRFKCAIIGDSYTQGGLAGESGVSVVSAAGIAMQISYWTGWDVYACGISATGYAKTSPPPFGDSARLASLATLPALDLIIVAGGANDVTNGYTNTQITTAAAALYSALATARPSTPIVVSGIQAYNGDASTVQAASDALKATALANPQVRGYIDWTKPTNWLAGTGNSSSQNGTGNADIFTSPDNVHPTRAGAEYVARRTVAELRKIQV